VGVSKSIISKKTRGEFREYMVSWVLRQIGMEFDAADIERDSAHDPMMDGQRRSLVEEYYHTLDFGHPRDVKKLLGVYESVLDEAENVEDERKYKVLCNCLKRDGFMHRDGRIVPVSGASALTAVKSVAEEFDAEHMAQQIRRIEEAIESDPDLAIGSAKELLETCCKTILRERDVEVEGKLDLPELLKITRAELSLVPDDVPNSAKGARTIKRVMSNLASIGQGVAELRSLYGTGHGRDGAARGLRPRHARLTVNCVNALVMFLFDTHRER
jgi:hypothetical protein